MTAPEHRALVEGYESGLSLRTLATQHNVHRTTVLEHLKRSGVQRQHNSRRLSDEQVRQAAALYAAGNSLLTVGARFTVNARTVRNAFDRAGIAVRPRRGWPSKDGEGKLERGSVAPHESH